MLGIVYSEGCTPCRVALSRSALSICLEWDDGAVHYPQAVQRIAPEGLAHLTPELLHLYLWDAYSFCPDFYFIGLKSIFRQTE